MNLRSLSPLLVAGLAAMVVIGPAADPATAGRLRGTGRSAPAREALAPLPSERISQHLSREVFGFLPYWEIDDGTDAYLRYDLLSTIAFFGVGYGVDGTLITTEPGYRAYVGDTATTIIQHAHAAGVRTVVTFEAFDAAENAAFLSDLTAQSTFIQQAVDLMASRGADGANVDIEGLSGTYFPAYGAFIGAFKKAAVAQNPAAEISVSTNANTSGARMAVAALANGADRAFIMGYNYRSAGSSPVGSIAPLVRADGGLSLTRTLDIYAQYGAPAGQLLLGLPYYGRTWPTVSDQLHAARQTDTATYGGSSAFFPSSLPDSAAGATATYDTVEQSAVLIRYDETRQTWLQTYYDDPQSLAPKLQLAADRGLAGVGMWALGYDRGQPGYWDVLSTVFQGPQLASVTISPSPTRQLAVTVQLSWGPSGQPVTQVRLSNDRRTWSAWRPAAAAVSWTLAAGTGDGARTIYVQLRDAGGVKSPVASASVVLDRAGPVVTMLRLAFSTSAGVWVATFNARDLTGVTRYQVRYRIGSGAWRTVERAPDGTTFRIRASAKTPVGVQVRARDALGTWGAWHAIARP